MRFVLVYRGQLSATQGNRGKRRQERVEIRKQIRPQLERLWAGNAQLAKLLWDARVPGPQTHVIDVGDSPLYEHYRGPPQFPMQDGFIDLCEPIVVCGKQFRPIVRKSLDLTCSLNIMFLRQEDPGSLFKKAGDIDNRIKTFIDALEIPSHELEGDEVDGVNFVLLENDTLVRGLSIDTERLLLPELDFPNQVHLIAEVTVHVERVGRWNMCLL